MMLKTREMPFHLKSTGSKGEFEGYGSVFDVIDSYRDVVVPGAFTDTLAAWKAKDRLPPCLWQHSSRDPIGPHTLMEEDSRGLRVAGRLLIDKVAKASEAHALLESGTIGGMSIGYAIPDGGEEYDSKAGILRLIKIDLWECSLVTFPANSQAVVDQVKSVLSGGRLPELKHFEEFLREVGGFSKAQATTIASLGLGKLRREAEGTGKVDASEVIEDVKSLVAAAAKSIPFSLRTE